MNDSLISSSIRRGRIRSRLFGAVITAVGGRLRRAYATPTRGERLGTRGHEVRARAVGRTSRGGRDERQSAAAAEPKIYPKRGRKATGGAWRKYAPLNNLERLFALR